MGYRQTDPLNSRLMAASAAYVFSPKYAVSTNVSYDFGLKSGINNGVTFTRMGADVQLSIGASYNALLNNFNFNFMIMPNLFLGSSRGTGALNANMLNNSTPGGAGH